MQVDSNQRKYGPPPEGGERPRGCELYIGRLPCDAFEADLVPALEIFGRIWELRLMLDPHCGGSRCFGFVTYATKEQCRRAFSAMSSGPVLLGGRQVRISAAWNQHRLYIGNIPKTLAREELMEAFSEHLVGIVECFVYGGEAPSVKNRGFCFLVSVKIRLHILR